MLLVPHPSYRTVTSALLSKKIPTLPRYRLLVQSTSKVRGNADTLAKTRQPQTTVDASFETNATFKKANELFEAYDLSWKNKSRRHGRKSLTTHAPCESNALYSETATEGSNFFKCPPEIILHIVNFDLDNLVTLSRTCKAFYQCLTLNATRFWAELAIKKSGSLLNSGSWAIRRGCLHPGIFDKLSRLGAELQVVIEEAAFRGRLDIIQSVVEARGLAGSTPSAFISSSPSSSECPSASKGVDGSTPSAFSSCSSSSSSSESPSAFQGLAGSTPYAFSFSSSFSSSSESPPVFQSLAGSMPYAFPSSSESPSFISDRSVAWASMMGHIHIVRLLLDLGGQATKEALVGAARNCRTQVVELLLERSPVGKLSTGEALEISLAYGRTDIAKLLLGKQCPLIPSTQQLPANCMTCSQGRNGGVVQPLQQVS